MKIRGKVKKGLGIGKKLGYPTANLECGESICPMPGVYAAQVTLNGNQHNGVVVVGARAYHGKPLIEVLLLDFKGELYGQTLEVELLDKISGIEKFDNNGELKKKIEEDIRRARLYFTGNSV